MDWDKKTFKDFIKRQREYKKDGVISEYGEGVLYALERCENLILFGLSNSANGVIDYVEKDAEIAMPINEMFTEDGENLTKKQYGKVLLKYLVKELREHFC